MALEIDWPRHLEAMTEAAARLGVACDLLLSQLSPPDLPAESRAALVEALEHIEDAMAALPGGRPDA